MFSLHKPDFDGAVGHYTLAIGSVRAEIFEKPNKGKLKLLLSSYYTSRAAALTKLKQYDEALEDCKCALEFDQNAIKAYQRRARVYMQLGKLNEAIETYDQAFKIDAEAVATDRKHTEQTRDRFESAKAVIEKQRKFPQ
jgi:tetratricopeptide (TPR) repeat protein